MPKDITLQELPDILGAFSSFIIMGHEEPDGDCLTSSFVLSEYLRALGHEVFLCSAGPFKRPEVLSMSQKFLPDFPEECPKDKTLCIIVDCSSLDRTGYPAEYFSGRPLLIIDHHVKAEDLAGDYCYIDSGAPSSTVLIQRILEMDGEFKWTPELAEELFLGFSTDTGFFRHLDEQGGDALHAVARLCEAGASPKRVHSRLAVKQSAGTVGLIGRILQRMEFFYDGRLVLSWEVPADREELQTNDRNSALIYSILSSIDGVEAIALLRDEGDKCVGGLRSLDKIDVSRIARLNGGGGHKNASGFAREISLSDLKIELLTQFKEAFSS